MPCYQCYWCKKGQYIQCSALGTIGAVWDGAFADYAVVPSDCIYKIPDNLSFDAACIVEPLACVFHAVRRANVRPGDSVAIIGAGPIGLLTMQVAKACGAGLVVVVEVMPKRSKIATEMGAHAVFNPNEVDVGREIAKLTENRRVDIAFECAGPPAAMLTALKVSAKGGKIVEIGMMEGTCDFPFFTLWWQEKTIITSQGYTDEYPAAISFLSEGRVRVEPLITGRIKLDNIVEEGFQVLTGKSKLNHGKIIVTPE
jgi:(R,R)-butanediol dehydrogenase/meso-butanediol dehydrogenase/diacetyl reductase